MNLVPVPDMGWTIIAAIMGLSALAILVPLSILIETFVLHIYLPQARSFWHSLRDSFVMNLVSGLLGFGGICFGWPALSLFNERTGGSYYRVSPAAKQTTLLSMVIYWALSVVIEGLILTRLEKGQCPLHRIWSTCLIANILSYVALLVALWMNLG